MRRVPVGTWRPEQPDAAPRELNTAAGVPVALTCNRDSHVVMMATPPDLQELAPMFGRASCEMVHKAAAAAIDLLVAVSVPVPLAVEFAERCSVALVGFARTGRHDVYTFADRIMDGDSR